MPHVQLLVIASILGNVGTWIVVPVVVAALTAIATLIVTKAGDATDRRRERYAKAVQALVAWVEFPYRVRRRTSDDPETLAGLANVGHDLQESLACNEAWIATEYPKLARRYAQTRATVNAAVGPDLTEAWESPPVRKAAEMNLGPWGPARMCATPIAELQKQVESRFGLRRLAIWNRP